MRGDLCLRNRQRARNIDARRLRAMIRHLLEKSIGADNYDLAAHLVGALEMTRLNETRLRHAGSTDVISFDYSESATKPLAGEIFVCVDEAIVQAARFRTTWQEELARYIVHGVLHLRAYDDVAPAARRRMRREEDRLVEELRRRFDLRKLEMNPKLTG
jgi:probable rRNA maturation factor